MSLTGILLDVSGSMQESIRSGTDEKSGTWAQSIFKVIDYLVEHDLTSEDRVFAVGVGASCGREIFDVIGTVQQIKNTEMPNYRKNCPATESNINKIFDVLEKNGARNIRKWVKDMTLIQEAETDYMAALILTKLESDEQFLNKFMDEILPPSCRRDRVPTASNLQSAHIAERTCRVHILQSALDLRTASTNQVDLDVQMVNFLGRMKDFVTSAASSVAISAISFFRQATRKDIEEVIRKAKCYFLKEEVSIFSVKDASRIVRGCVDEKELSKERAQELLENVEPFIYGKTPLYKSLEKTIELFEGDTSHNKLLFVLSDGKPTDGNNEDSTKINQITSKLKEAGVTVVSCYITRSTHISAKRLYDKMQPDWENGAKFMFSLSSIIPTQYLPRAIMVKRGWKIDIDNNETKLFVQVNHPDNLREACQMAQDVVCCPDTLSELLVSVDLDIYISASTSGLKAKKQEGGTCYANASAAVLHLAMKRILGREGGYPDFHALKDEMIKEYGIDGADTSQVLMKMCKEYRLHCKNVSVREAMKAVVKKRPVVATFHLSEDGEWKAFRNFYKKYPTGTLTQNELDVRKRPKNPEPKLGGHAVVLTSYNSKCLTLMNSWGQQWGDNGFFRVQNADVLELKFFDVYWTLDDLTHGEKEYYRRHGSDVANKLMESLKGLQKAEYACPKCNKTSLVTEFT